MWGFKGLLLLLGTWCLFYVCQSTPVVTYLPTEVPDVVVTDTETNKVCILAKFDITLNVTYTDALNNVKEVSFGIPVTADKSGSCNDDIHVSYTWAFERSEGDPEQYAPIRNNVKITWKKNDDNSTYIESIDFEIYTFTLPDPGKEDDIVTFKADSLNLLPATYSRSLSCQGSKEHPIQDNESGNSITIFGVYQLGEWDQPKPNEKLPFTDGDQCSYDKENGGDSSKSPSGSNVGAIAGGVVAALVVLICVTAFGLHFYRRNKRHSIS